MLKQSLQKHPLKTSITGCTDVGRVRKNNEDNFFVADLSSVPGSPFPCAFAVADGMGGLEKGEVASGIAVKYLQDLFTTANITAFAGKMDDEAGVNSFLVQTVQEINRQICAESRNNEGGGAMGTTLTFGVQKGDTIFIAHVGDSRAYLIRRNAEQITKDHSFVAELVEAGMITEKDAKAHPQRNVISRCLGNKEHVDIDIIPPRRIKPGDYLLLCTDGLTGKVGDKEIRDTVLCDYAEMPIVKDIGESKCYSLIARANERGGEDNITVILAHFEGESSSSPGDHATMRLGALGGSKRHGSKKWLLIGLQLAAAAIVGVMAFMYYKESSVEKEGFRQIDGKPEDAAKRKAGQEAGERAAGDVESAEVSVLSGEGYEKQGDFSIALGAYRRALSLSPENTRAREGIERCNNMLRGEVETKSGKAVVKPIIK